jgi:predicted nucleic acid-binding protein
LIEAKAKGLLQRIKPLLDDLQNDAGFRMSESLRARVLQAAGE